MSNFGLITLGASLLAVVASFFVVIPALTRYSRTEEQRTRQRLPELIVTSDGLIIRRDATTDSDFQSGTTEAAKRDDQDSEQRRPANSAAEDALTVGTYGILREYSAQGLAQSRVSFWTSIVFAALGFFVILGGIAVAVLGRGPARESVIPVISGAVVEAVSVLFFGISARTQTVMVSFFDKLREDRRLEEALKIVSGIQDPVMASRLQVLLALQFVGMDDMPSLYKQAAGEHPGPNNGAGSVRLDASPAPAPAPTPTPTPTPTQEPTQAPT